MAKYKIEIAKSAEKTLVKLPQSVLKKIISALESLTVNPYPLGARKLQGTENIYRIRINVYRIIYEIHKNILLIKILKIGHRKDIYRLL